MTQEMLKSKGNTPREKANNFWISYEAEEKCLADCINEMLKNYSQFDSVKLLCIAAAYL